ncbi:MAG: DegT/DnrJ/EryC1/StrS family aminotransferase [Verrucomicrobiota bacterium]
MIALNDFGRQWQVVAPRVLEAVARVGKSGRYILGAEVERFEAAIAKRFDVTHAVGVGNGMDALEIALRCLDLRLGEKVLTTPLSAFATTLAIIRAGGVPVFVDVDDFGALDLEKCRRLLERDRSIRFLLPVHLYGFVLDLEKLLQLKNEFDLRVVEDCAQAIGARAVGTVGQVNATSFYPTKNLGALGDGGALLTNDADISRRASALRNYGQTSQYVHETLGLNSRLDEMHAAIMTDALLPELDAWTKARREIASKYLAGISNSAICLLRPPTETKPVWHLFPILVAAHKRDHFREHLRSCGIQTGVHYPRLIPEQSAMKSVKFEIEGALTNSQKFSASEVSLPIHPFLSKTEIESIIDACNAWQA